MVNLDQDHATLRVRYDSAKAIHEIKVIATSPAGEYPRVYIYEMVETIPPGTTFGKIVSLNYVSTLQNVADTFTLVANTKYYVVAVSDAGALYHEKLFESVVLTAPNTATFTDPAGVPGGSTSQIIITLEGVMPA